VDRVKWFRDRAERDRWKEEIEILEEEFVRTEKSHTTMMETWSALAEHRRGQPGWPAYANKQSEMYRELARDCTMWHERAKTEVKGSPIG